MFGAKKADVLIVGAGPVGLFAALALTRRGVQVQIVDREWRTGAHSYALALHGRSLALLQSAGLHDRILQRAYKVGTVGLYDAETRRAELRLSDGGKDSSLAVMRQDVLEHLLEDELRRAGVEVRWNHEVSRLEPQDGGVEVTIDEMEKDAVGYAAAHTEWVVRRSHRLDVPFVIGADGHRSFVRRTLRIDFPEVGPAQHFAVFEFRSDADPEHQMRIVMQQQATSALWPLPDGHYRWSFQLADFTAGESTRMKDRIGIRLGRAQYPVLAEENLRALAAERAPWFRGSVEQINWRIVVRFERRLASRFGSGRVWLAGDAGHMTGPVGMQSMNVGLLEAEELADIIAGILQQDQSPERLQAYGNDRLRQWRRLLGLEGSLQSTGQANPWIAQYSDRLLCCLPACDAELAGLAEQLGLKLR